MEDNQLIREYIQRQEDYNESNSKNMEKILRGLYGEEENGTVGLIGKVKQMESNFDDHVEDNLVKFKSMMISERE